MEKIEIQKKIDKNRDLIDKALYMGDIQMRDYTVRRLAKDNARLLDILSKKANLFITLLILFLCSCSEDAPVPDCYELAKRLEKEQFEAYQSGESINDILALRKEYEEKFPDCLWY